MRPVIRVLCASTVALLIPACGGVEPLGPSPVDQGVLVFMNAGYRGISQQVGSDVSDLGRVEGPCNISDDGGMGSWNDCISSVRVLPGFTARLYGDRNFRGSVVEVTADVSDLKSLKGECSGSFDDCISSIRVIKR